MVSYLLQENGDRIILEQGGGFLILEDGLPGTSVIYGGDDAPRKRKHQRTYHDLFREIEQTIHNLVDPPEDVREPAEAVAQVPETTQEVKRAIEELVELAAGQHALLQQAASLRADLAQWEANRRRFLEEDEADWEWFM